MFIYFFVCKALGEITIDPIVIRKKHFFNSVTDEPVSFTQELKIITVFFLLLIPTFQKHGWSHDNVFFFYKTSFSFKV